MAKGGSGPTVSTPQARGILTKQKIITFYKDVKSSIKLKGSAKRPAANSIITPDFKFEDMGIRGLDTEFSAIFRRAFASRIFPQGLIENLGIQHVKGSLLDGVEQLNNILLIGMTNRMDMIDDALLRPGRLEVHIEISLPDQRGRVQILKIHTSKMRGNNAIDPDVNVLELATLTKNFSRAEIGGLVKSASSFAFNRHVKFGTVVGISDDVENMKVNCSDFMKALDEVKPGFEVSEGELENTISGGIFHFSPYVDDILKDSLLFVDLVRTSKTTSLLSVLLHGPLDQGKPLWQQL